MYRSILRTASEEYPQKYLEDILTFLSFIKETETETKQPTFALAFSPSTKPTYLSTASPTFEFQSYSEKLFYK